MSKKHIITFGYQDYAVDSLAAATSAITLLAKLTPVRYVTEGDSDGWHYTPDERQHQREREVSLKMNQPFRDAAKEKKPKPLALPKPKRGSIMCICEKSHVAPKETCPHCGRAFAESHNRTHGSDIESKPQLRLL
ncbi:hypothetical protein OKA04_04500 [Luteolibacter flavescens]|uniref:C2H2-type domain-containing protein n=1 Tax=Luteolibacter flavescens TaxID=1859460 RepID=A0ABT3FK76_9BACT|nr:hypothetical protein [Luteolibacter flavescens]MCW1883976.1 hypothetical protein [Luteolibacter flavescens]